MLSIVQPVVLSSLSFPSSFLLSCITFLLCIMVLVSNFCNSSIPELEIDAEERLRLFLTIKSWSKTESISQFHKLKGIFSDLENTDSLMLWLSTERRNCHFNCATLRLPWIRSLHCPSKNFFLFFDVHLRTSSFFGGKFFRKTV